MRRKVLIITYYWPPSGGAGVQRWLKFCKYLPQMGWTPVVYTPENGEMPSIDESLLKDIPEEAEVIKRPIWEPYSVYKKFVGQKKDEKINTGFLSEREKPKKTENLAVWIRGNFFIPDARKFWIKPSIKYLKEYLKNNAVDAIISTGPPHSMHLIAHGLKRKFDIPWIADFRDPWTNIDFYKDLKLTKGSDKKHHELERKVLNSADVVLSVGNTLGKELEELGAKRVEVITNGYDLPELQEEVEMDKKISIAHIGSMTGTRNPEVLWMALKNIIANDPNIKNTLEIKLVGKVDFKVMKSIEEHGLSDLVRKIEYLPHDEVLKEQRRSHILLLVVNNTPNAKGIVTGKVFEYMASGRPILCIGPEDGDVAGILEDTKSGKVCSYTNVEKVEQTILELRNYTSQPLLSDEIKKYSRESLTTNLVGVLENLVD